VSYLSASAVVIHYEEALYQVYAPLPLPLPLLLYGIHLWADLDGDRRVGGSRPNQNDYVFLVRAYF